MSRVIWGVFLIVAGGLLLAERFAGLHVPSGSIWPLLIFALALGHFVRGRIGTGVMFTLIGATFLACAFGWFGMTYHRSWPLLMVAAGAGMVVKAITGGESWRWRAPEGHHE
jgi:hypothetical protein